MDLPVVTFLILSLAQNAPVAPESEGSPAAAIEPVTVTLADGPESDAPVAPVIETVASERIISETVVSVTPLDCDCEKSADTGTFRGWKKRTFTPVTMAPPEKREGLIPWLWARTFGKKKSDGADWHADDEVVVTVVHELPDPEIGETLTLVSSVVDETAGEEVLDAAKKAKAPSTAAGAPAAAAPTPVLEPSRADDFSWIQGRLQWVHVNGGAWVVRYAPLDKADIHGGSVVLVRDRRFQDFHEGDFVRLEGEILSQKSSVFLGGPLYRVQHITMLASSSSDAPNP